jgi:hypothetical protein
VLFVFVLRKDVTKETKGGPYNQTYPTSILEIGIGGGRSTSRKMTSRKTTFRSVSPNNRICKYIIFNRQLHSPVVPMMTIMSSA